MDAEVKKGREEDFKAVMERMRRESAEKTAASGPSKETKSNSLVRRGLGLCVADILNKSVKEELVHAIIITEAEGAD